MCPKCLGARALEALGPTAIVFTLSGMQRKTLAKAAREYELRSKQILK